MDSAVALVQAYLYANGFFTVTEYPIIARGKDDEFHSVTDLDILAVRFPGAGRIIPHRGGGGKRFEEWSAPDPALDVCRDRLDLLIGEVKEGKPEFNPGTLRRDVMHTALTRFGAVAARKSGPVIDQLLRDGEAFSPEGPRIRLIAFGAGDRVFRRDNYLVIGLGHVVSFIEESAKENWDAVRRMQFKDPAMSFLMVLLKASGKH